MLKKNRGKFDIMRRLWIRWKVLTIMNPQKKADWLRKHKVFHYIGKNVNYKSVLLPAEPFLVAIHDNVYLAADVRLVTHSLTNVVFNNYSKTKDYFAPFGKIEIHSNVFVGAGATIMYGVTIGEKCIVAAGAVVTKNVPAGSVVAGVPAKVIGTFEESMNKAKMFSSEFLGQAKSKSVIDLLKIRPVKFDIDDKDFNK